MLTRECGWKGGDKKQLGVQSFAFTSVGDELVLTTEKTIDTDRPSHGRANHSSIVVTH